MGLSPARAGALERVGQQERAGIVLAAVDAVGIGGDRGNPGSPVERHGEAQQEFGVAPAASAAAHRDRRLAARDQRAGRLCRLPVAARPAWRCRHAPARHRAPRLRSRCRGSAAETRLLARPAPRLRGRPAGWRRQGSSRCRKRGSPGFRRLGLSGSRRCSSTDPGISIRYFSQDRDRLGGGASGPARSAPTR